MKGEHKYSAKSDAKQMPKHLPDVVILRITPSPPVLFDAPQIPAGMHPFRRIPPDSTGIEPEYTGMALE